MDRRKFLMSGAALAATAGLGKMAAMGLNSDSPAEQELKNQKADKAMNIVIITGSPRQRGNTNHLADRFTAGAEEAGHSVFRFDSARSNVHGCTACNACGMDGDCVLKDDYTNTLLPKLLAADMVVICTPMYYFGFSSQIKAVIDRFYSRTYRLTGGKKTALLMAYANNAERDEKPIIEHYKRLASYMQWEDMGMVIAPGMWPAGSVVGTKYADEAYQLGKSL